MEMNWLERMGMKSFLHLWELRGVTDQMRRLGGDVSGQKVLEIGCGAGISTEFILKRFYPLHIDAVELDPAQIRDAGRRLLPRYEDKVNLHTASATRMPFPDGTFDAVFDFGALHHIPDNQLAINEAARVLRANGKFFFQEILSGLTMSFPLRHILVHPPEAQFSCQELFSKLKGAGFVIPESCSVANSIRVVGIALKG